MATFAASLNRDSKELREHISAGPQTSTQFAAENFSDCELLSDEQKARLKPVLMELAKQNATLDQAVTTMVDAAKKFDERVQALARARRMRQQQRAAAAAGGEDGDDPAEEDVDFNAMFEEEMAKATDAAAGVDPKQHNMYKGVLKIVGEEEEEGSGSDDDVAIDRTRGEVNLKCSFTGTLFVDPVKSRVCGHTFSKAILGYIRSRGHAAVCPMGGCNQPMRADDMEPDHAMEIKAQLHAH